MEQMSPAGWQKLNLIQERLRLMHCNQTALPS